jgi:hypothetical protein
LGRQTKLASERLIEFLESYIARLAVQDRGETASALEKVEHG